MARVASAGLQVGQVHMEFSQVVGGSFKNELSRERRIGDLRDVFHPAEPCVERRFRLPGWPGPFKHQIRNWRGRGVADGVELKSRIINERSGTQSLTARI